MKLKRVERQEKCLVAFTIGIEKEEWEAAIAAAYRKNVGRMNIPGFRKGKAPRKMVEALYGEGVFYQEAVNATYGDAYDKALEETGLKPIARADIEIGDIDHQDGYTFTATFPIAPEIEIGQYKNLSAYMPPGTVTEEDVSAELDRMRERNARLVTVERPARMGDTLTLDYEGFAGDVAFEGGKAEQYTIQLGSGRLIPGFEDGLVGAEIEKPLDVKVVFPEEYHAPDLAGRPAVFHCLVHEIKEKQMPDLDDEFAKDVSDFDTLEDYRNSVREWLAEKYRTDAETAFEESLIDQIIAGMKGDVPEVMVEDQFRNIVEDMNSSFQSMGMDFSRYLQMGGADPEYYRSMAERQVKARLIFEKVAELEKLELGDGELEAEYERLAEVYNKDAAEVKELLSEETLRRDMLAMKAAELIRESGVKTDVPPPKEEPPETVETAEMTEEPEKPEKSKPKAKSRSRRKES